VLREGDGRDEGRGRGRRRRGRGGFVERGDELAHCSAEVGGVQARIRLKKASKIRQSNKRSENNDVQRQWKHKRETKSVAKISTHLRVLQILFYV